MENVSWTVLIVAVSLGVPMALGRFLDCSGVSGDVSVVLAFATGCVFGAAAPPVISWVWLRD